MINPTAAQKRFAWFQAIGFAAEIGLAASYAKYHASNITLIASIFIAIILCLVTAYYALLKRELYSMIGSRIVSFRTGVRLGWSAIAEGLFQIALVGLVVFVALVLRG